jgi:hypothetical protein
MDFGDRCRVFDGFERWVERVKREVLSNYIKGCIT